jgi:hypothetical protein
VFTPKRSNTLVRTIEATYGIDLNARGDASLGNLLQQRGFDSLTQLLTAFRGNATRHARRRRLFLSFDAKDKQQVQGFRLMAFNDGIDLDFYDGSLQEAIDSERGSYVKTVLRPRIQRASVVVCMIGNRTAWRDWVDWELRAAVEMRKGLCGVRLKGAFGRTPPFLNEIGAPIAQWDTPQIVAAIECAAARRS